MRNILTLTCVLLVGTTSMLILGCSDSVVSSPTTITPASLPITGTSAEPTPVAPGTPVANIPAPTPTYTPGTTQTTNPTNTVAPPLNTNGNGQPVAVPVIVVNPTAPGAAAGSSSSVLALAPPPGGVWQPTGTNAVASFTEVIPGVAGNTNLGTLPLQTDPASGALEIIGTAALPAGTITVSLPSFSLTAKTAMKVGGRNILPGSTFLVPSFTMVITVNAAGTWTMPVSNNLILSQLPNGKYVLGGTFGTALWDATKFSVPPASGKATITLVLNPTSSAPSTTKQIATVSNNACSWLGHSVAVQFDTVNVTIDLR